MRCPHPPGTAGRLGRCLQPAARAFAAALALALATASPVHAAPTSAKTAQPAASAPTAPKPSKKKAATAGSKVAKKTSKTTQRTRTGSKNNTAKKATAAGTGAAAAAEATANDTADRDSPQSGIRLPLMLRVTPALPDDPAALQSRLDQIVARQGEGGQGATVGSVRQLGPDIYAFSLQCADAEQCQRLRLAIESERDWVAGLQLDERRHVPRTPDRHSPAAR